MARKALTDTLWDQLQSTMIKYGCYQTQNSREIMEAILWKLRLGVTYLKNYVRGKQPIVVSTAGRKLAYGRIFFWL